MSDPVPGPGDATQGDPSPARAPRPATGASGSRIGPYEIRGELGRGGMGVVYRAFRADLGREFALKVIRAGADAEPESVARFVREARSAASLAGHPGIVGVHDIGQAEGQAYFAMDLVDGESLEALARREAVTPQQAAYLVAQAARAVQHAHERGILHRDLKPANVLVTRDGRALVADFGLAKAQETGPEGARLTKSGQVLGTPAYMPPEQAAGERLDARADVYSLGATLYEALTGVPPFAGETALNVLAQVVSAEPVAPRKRDPRVPRDLDVIAMACLEKSPDRRYATAAALADDLDRFAAGEPIRARPPSLLTRIGRRVARRKATVGVTAVALVLLVGGGAFVLPRWFRAEAASLARMRQVTEMALDAALRLRRAGDLEGMQAFAAQVETACAEAAAAMPRSPEPHFRLGRMRRALMREAQAGEALDAALARDPRYAPALYERVVLTLRKHDARMAELGTAELRRAGRAFDASLRARDQRDIPIADPRTLAEADPLARDLEARMRADGEALAAQAGALTAAERSYLRGVLAHLRGAPQEARTAFEESHATDATLVEASEALGQSIPRAGHEAEVVAHWDRAIAADRGYVPYWEKRAIARLNRAYAPGVSPAEALAVATGGREDLERACAALPARPGLPDLLARALLIEARIVESIGEDPGPLLARGEQVLRRSLLQAPDDAAIVATLGNLVHMRGVYLARHGGDPEPAWTEAQALLDRALALAPEAVGAWRNRADTHLNRGLRLAGRGGDPRAAYEAAAADLDQALRLDPTDARTWTERGGVALQVVRWLLEQGQDPRPAGGGARRALEEAIRQRPEETRARTTLGCLHVYLGSYNVATGGDPEPHYAAGLEVLDEAVRRDPTSAEARVERARLHAARGQYLGLRGGDPRAPARAALEDYDAALALEPQDADVLGERGAAHVTLAATNVDQPGDLRRHLAAAMADLDAALRLTPGEAALLAKRATAHVMQAATAPVSGVDPEAALAGAVADLTAALDRKPGDANLLTQRGKARRTWLEHRLAARAEPAAVDEVAAAAIDDLTESLRLDPRSVETLISRGAVRAGWAFEQAQRGAPVPALVDGALADFATARTIDDRLPVAWKEEGDAYQARAVTRMVLGEPTRADWEAAIRCYERAAALNPAWGEVVAPLLETCRTQAAGSER